MAGELPDYYFRVRENGAAVFRVDTENRQRRIEMDQIAIINMRNGEIKPHGERTHVRGRPCADSFVDGRTGKCLGAPGYRRPSPRCRLPKPHDAMGAIQSLARSARLRHGCIAFGHARPSQHFGP